MVNGDWRILFPHVIITHLTVVQSDHKPLLLKTNPSVLNRPKTFRFVNMWIRDPWATDIIFSSWNDRVRGSLFFSSIEKIRKTKTVLRVWNKKVFGHVKESIEEKKAIIESLQNQTQTAENLAIENLIQNELDEILKREEIL